MQANQLDRSQSTRNAADYAGRVMLVILGVVAIAVGALVFALV